MRKLLIIGAPALALALGAVGCKNDSAPEAEWSKDAGKSVERARAAERTEPRDERDDLSGGYGLFDRGPHDGLIEANDDVADKVADLAADLDEEADELVEMSEKDDVDQAKIGEQLEKVTKLSDELEIELSRLDAYQSEVEAAGVAEPSPDVRREDVAIPK